MSTSIAPRRPSDVERQLRIASLHLHRALNTWMPVKDGPTQDELTELINQVDGWRRACDREEQKDEESNR